MIKFDGATEDNLRMAIFPIPHCANASSSTSLSATRYAPSGGAVLSTSRSCVRSSMLTATI
jgi:hypothetical protein